LEISDDLQRLFFNRLPADPVPPSPVSFITSIKFSNKESKYDFLRQMLREPLPFINKYAILIIIQYIYTKDMEKL